MKVTMHSSDYDGMIVLPADDMTRQERKDLDALYNLDWCECDDGNPVEVGELYYEDGQHPKLHKHHYRHEVCGGITQIG